MANDLDVSRSTVLEAYSQLMAEGYLQGNHGSGTVVASGISKYTIPGLTPASQKSQTHASAGMKEDVKLIDFQ
ncbi:GntR family transcriptional regulator [Acetobacterium bakii]|uniref:GntR family transcriptional regulator n=1 Tax=Acetobacterium bakii TaxID=52689 RepID=UPI00311A1780